MSSRATGNELSASSEELTNESDRLEPAPTVLDGIPLLIDVALATAVEDRPTAL
jgi:hypothetical protein